LRDIGDTLCYRNSQDAALLTNESRKHVIYLYIMEFYSATKKNKILSFAGKWMELENIILSEVSQAQKVKSHKSWKEGEAP
jgi:hypothetical protein